MSEHACRGRKMSWRQCGESRSELVTAKERVDRTMSVQYDVLIMGFPLFQGFTLHGAQMLLDCGEVKEYASGEVVLKERDSPTFVLLVLTGHMRVFVERAQGDMVLSEAGPGTILGELAVLCGIPRTASVRTTVESAALRWSAAAFRTLLLQNVSLSQRIFRESLRSLIDKERLLIDSLMRLRDNESE